MVQKKLGDGQQGATNEPCHRISLRRSLYSSPLRSRPTFPCIRFSATHNRDSRKDGGGHGMAWTGKISGHGRRRETGSQQIDTKGLKTWYVRCSWARAYHACFVCVMLQPSQRFHTNSKGCHSLILRRAFYRRVYAPKASGLFMVRACSGLFFTSRRLLSSIGL